MTDPAADLGTDPSIRFRCPRCKTDLTNGELACASCGATFHTAASGALRVIDFLSREHIFECRCPDHQGNRRCRVTPDDLEPPPPGPKAVHHKQKIFKSLMNYRGKVMLDVGCREGPIGHLLAKENHMIGVDICPRSVFLDTPNVLDKGYREILIADANALPIADAQVDLILANDVLEHTELPQRLMAEFHRALKPGGELLVTVPNLVSYNNRITILFGSGVGIELHRLLMLKDPVNPICGVRFPDQSLHLRFFTLKSLCKQLASIGFEIVVARGYDPVLSRIPGADRLLRNWCSLAFVLARKGLAQE